MVTLERDLTVEEYLLAHQQRREDFMSEDEIAEAGLFVDWFRESWKAKDSIGLFDKWNEVDDAWRGVINAPQYPDDPGSETNIINPHIEGQVALMCKDPVSVYVKATDPTDAPYQQQAQAILEFVSKENGIKSKMEYICRRLVKDGSCFVTVMWDKDCLNGKGAPSIKTWNPRLMFPDFAITDAQDFQDSRYFIIAVSKTLEWAMRNFGEEKVAAITPGYHCVEDQWDYSAGTDWSEYEMENQSYIHLYVMTRRNSKGGKMRFVEMSSDGVILRETSLIDDTYPVFFAEQMHDEGHLFGCSTVEQLLPIQDLINDINDQIITNARLTGNPQKVVSSASGIDISLWTNEAGLNVAATDLSENPFIMVNPPSMPGYIINYRDTLLYSVRQIVGRFSDNMAGIAQQGVDTATEAAALQSSGLAIIDSHKRKIQDMMGKVMTYALRLCENFWTTEMAFRVTGKEEFFFMRPSKLKEIPILAPANKEYIEKARQQAIASYRAQAAMQGIFDIPEDATPPDWTPPQYMMYKDDNGKTITREAVYDIEVDFGADVPSNKAFLLNAAKEAMMAKAVDPTEYRQILRDLRILPYLDVKSEQEIVGRIRAMQDALLKQTEASAAQSAAQAQMAGAPQPGQAPPAQGQIGGTPAAANPLAQMPNPVIRGMTGVNRIANPASQGELALSGAM